MGFFLLFLSLVRFFEKDLYGFSIFLFFSSLFLTAFFLENYKQVPQINTSDERKKVFLSLAQPRITSRTEGNSHIVTLIVPSLELFNEMKNNGNIKAEGE
jgi:hypothetical protein